MIQELIELFISFTKIGFTSFGGLSMVPLINVEMVNHGWMTQTEVSDIVAIAEMTPGPVGLNCATFAGIRVAGMAGALSANFGMLVPTFTLCLIVAIYYVKFKDSNMMQRILYGIRPAGIGLIFATMLTLGISNYAPGYVISIPSMIVGCMIVAVMIKFPKISVVKIIIIAAILGLIIGGF
ncbi:MAG: chromate transporter [Lachnospiraceae bacterium]|nr:chromate transporter [Lachnospiraceae bacterium]